MRTNQFINDLDALFERRLSRGAELSAPAKKAILGDDKPRIYEAVRRAGNYWRVRLCEYNEPDNHEFRDAVCALGPSDNYEGWLEDFETFVIPIIARHET